METIPIILVLAALWFVCGFYTLQPQQSALLSFFGNPKSAVDNPGIHWRPLFFISVRKISNAIQEFAFKEVVFTKQEVEVASSTATISADAAVPAPAVATARQTAMAAVTVEGVVQFSVMTGMDNLVKATYRLADPKAMIKQRFQNALRGTMNVKSMWDALQDKDRSARSVQEDLTHVTVEFGHTINNISITNVTPDKEIVASNNEMIASVAVMQTRANKGRGEQLETVAIAKGKADAMIENGRGIAGERDKIIDGWDEAIKKMTKAMGGDARPLDVMAMVLFQNYLDMNVKLAAAGYSKVIFSNNSASGPADLLQEIRHALILSGEATAALVKPADEPPRDDTTATS